MKKLYFFGLLLLSWAICAQEAPSKKQVDALTGATYEKAIPDSLKYPEALLMLNDFPTLVVEKATHRLHLFTNKDGIPQYVRSYEITTGEKTGDKDNQGDKKTPEGIYLLTSFLSAKQLESLYGKDGKQYGVGAFVTDYPNIIDQMSKKTGSGIWLHSTDDESRIAKGLDSKGCVVMGQKEIQDISRFIELKFSTVVIVQELSFLLEETWKSNRQKLKSSIDEWLQAWQSKDFERYISFYHPNYVDKEKNYTSFKNHKKNVFKSTSKPKIEISNLSLLSFKDYAVVQFEQKYEANNLKDFGQKVIYLKKDKDYKWKIISETWNQYPDNKKVAFTPSMRFFNQTGNKNI